MRERWIMLLVVLVAISNASFSNWIETPTRSCEEALGSDRASTAMQALRSELREAMKRDLETGRRMARISNAVSVPYDRLRSVDSRVTENRAVVSLGSGPDILTLMHSFPLAKEFHLVDLMTGWGSGPSEIVSEIENRLGALVDGGSVRMISPGFLRYSPLESWAEGGGPWKRLNNGKWDFYVLPIVWEIQWQSPKLGFQRRKVFLHAMSFNSSAHMERLVRRLSVRGFGGVLIQGIPIPVQEVAIPFFGALIPNGILSVELNFHQRGDVDPSLNPQSELEELETIAEAGLVLEQKFEPSREMIEAYPTLRLPDSYVFRRTNN